MLPVSIGAPAWHPTSAPFSIAPISPRLKPASSPPQARLKHLVASYAQAAPKLSARMEKNIPEGFAVFSLPIPHQRCMRTSNVLERVIQELKRRTRVASLLPNEASLLRLTSALLCEINEERLSGKIYLNMNPVDLPQN